LLGPAGLTNAKNSLRLSNFTDMPIYTVSAVDHEDRPQIKDLIRLSQGKGADQTEQERYANG